MSGITKPGADTFAGQWQKFLDLKTPPKAPVPPAGAAPAPPPSAAPAPPPSAPAEQKSAQERFDECVTEIAGKIGTKVETQGGILVFRGYRASDTSDEALPAISALLSALGGLKDALETAAKDVLAIANEAEARHQFTTFVKAQHEVFQAALSQNLTVAKLDDAWNRRKADALWVPYATFSKMLDLDRLTRQTEVIALSVQLKQELAVYDGMQSSQSPSRIVKAISESEAQMYSVATDTKVSLQGIVSVLDAIYKDVSTLQTDYKDISAKAAAAQKALP